MLLETEGHPFFLYLDPIHGVPLNSWTLKPIAGVEEEANAMVIFSRSIKLAALVPMHLPKTGSILVGDREKKFEEVEAISHIQPLCVLMEDLSVN